MRQRVTRQPTGKLTVRLPLILQEQARQRARTIHRSLNGYIVEAVQQRVEQPEPETVYPLEHERMMAVLKECGAIKLGPEWDGLLSGRPLKTHEEILEMMAGQRPLSEDVIEMRGEL